LIEMSATNFLPKLNKTNCNIIYYITYNIFLKKYFFLTFINFKKKSVSFLWKNSLWLEREIKEFYNIKITDSTDTRNLFLDYNVTYNPLLKSFPVEGVEEVYFNVSQNNLIFLKTNHIEL
jgi:NADH:ubiquinone oxidoreductase subunit C